MVRRESARFGSDMAAIGAKVLKRLRDALDRHQVSYLVIGRGGAIPHGFADTTQDIFAERSEENAERLIRALQETGVEISEGSAVAIREGRDFVQLEGKVSIEVVHAPDGIDRFDGAWRRGRAIEGFAVDGLEDIIATKRAANRQKDRAVLPRLDRLRSGGGWPSAHQARSGTATPKHASPSRCSVRALDATANPYGD